jgi:O-antigen ligase
MTTSTGWSRSGSWEAYPDDRRGAAQVRDNQGKYVDFLLFALLPMAQFQAGGLPVSELAMGLAVAATSLRPARVRAAPWLMVPLVALLGMMALSGQLNEGIDTGRRLMHLVLFTVLAFAAAQGRFHTRSMAKGLAVGLLISAGAYYAGYGTDYEGRLAGLMADPNAAGFLLTTLGCIALAGLSGNRARALLGMVLVVLVVLTFSRTAFLAVGLIVLWVIIGRLLASTFATILLAAMIWLVTNVPVSLQTIGPFSDRSGSDALRRRIDLLERIQISEAPWYGHGPGTSKVDVSGELFFFHNSYLAVLNEGGRIAQVLIVLAGALTLIALLRLRPELRNPWYEAGIIALSVCAVNLGEVLLELPTALALGLAAAHVQRMRESPPPEVAQSPPTPSVLGSLDNVRLR